MAFEIEDGILKKYKKEPGVTEVTVPEGVAGIGEDVFYKCKILRQIIIPESVKSINDRAFACCDGLEQITIPEGVTEIGWQAFCYCTNLTRITIPEGVTYIGWNAFQGCTSLRVIKLRPDDPAVFRDYGEVKNLADCISKALEMLRTGAYGTSLDLKVKYPFIILHYLHTKDKKCAAFIKRSISKIMKDSISANDLEFIRAITRTEQFITKKNIDEFILQAQNEKQHTIVAFLLDYKKRYFGFEQKDDGLL